MTTLPDDVARIDHRVQQLFWLVSEALSGATDALLGGEPTSGQRVVDADQAIDDLTADLDRLVWDRIDASSPGGVELRFLVGVLLILPELERSADLAEHIAQRAVTNLGSEMSPVCRGIFQRMSEVALEMWRACRIAYAERTAQGVALDEADEEMDILHERLTREVSRSKMATPVAAQVTLLSRFYERIGDHAVNLARRVESFVPTDPSHERSAGEPG
jgi:phosphate transport system protein